MRQSAVQAWMRGAGLVLLLLLSAVGPLFAQQCGQPNVAHIITVTSTGDDGRSGELRQAVAEAESDYSSTGCPYTINFSLTFPATIVLNTPLTLGNMTVAGPEATNLAISGNNAIVVLIVNAGATVAISGVTIEYGSSLLGGGIFNDGTLTLTGCAISNNTQGTQLGGGIFNSGTLTLTNSTVSGNSVQDFGEPNLGGGIYNQGALTLINSTVSDNSAVATSLAIDSSNVARGGGIYSVQGTLTLINSTVSNNTATGTMYFGGAAGGIYSEGGPLTLTNSTVSNNTTDANGIDGGISFDDVETPFGYVSSSSDKLSLINSTVSGNRTNSGAGGISLLVGSATLINSTISGNSCGLNPATGCGGTSCSSLYNNSCGGTGGIQLADHQLSELSFTTITGNTCSSPISLGVCLRIAFCCAEFA